MRRVIPVIVATLGGLALLASFHTSALAPTRSGAVHAAGGRPAASAPPPDDSTTTGPPPSSGGPAPSSTTTTTAAGGRREVDGQDISTRYGDVQVRIVVQGGQLVDVQALLLPQDRERSARISEFAEPELHDEALQAQSANIDIVSGATYTSEGYAQSLQSALDAAGLHR